MQANKGNTLIIVIIATLAIILLVWLTMMKPTSQEADILKQEDVDSEMSASEKKIVQTLADVGNIKIDTSVLNNPAFNVLVDKSRHIVDEPLQRANPFAPIDINEVNAANQAILNSSNNIEGLSGNGDNSQNSNGVNLTPRDYQ